MIRSKAELLELADSLETSPGIVAGRYRHLTERWEFYTDLTRKFQLGIVWDIPYFLTKRAQFPQ